MRHHNTVFCSVLKHVPWHVFERIVDEHGADARLRQLSMKDQFVALLYCQLPGASSPREIETGLASHGLRLYHLGARPAQRSTLADASAQHPCAVFAKLFAHIAAQVHRRLRHKIAETTHLIDSTGVRLSAMIAFVLLRLAQAAQQAVQCPLAFPRLVRGNLMHARRIDRLLKPPPNLTANQNPWSFQFP